MNTYIITGANGFIGKKLVQKLLDNGNFVYAFVTDQSSLLDLASNQLIVKVGFFSDYERMFSEVKEPVDCVFHLAWKGLCGNDVKNYTDQLLDAKAACDALVFSAKLHARKFVLISSINVLESFDVLLNKGKGVPRYTNIYSAAKMAAELMGKTIAGNSGIAFNAAYLSMAYGPGNFSKMVPNVVISSLIKGISPKLVSGYGLYDLIFIDDIVTGLLAIAEKGINLKTYYLGHENIRTFKEIFTDVGNIVNPKIPLLFGAYPGDSFFDFSLIDKEALKKDTGFVPSSPFKESVIETAKWIQSNISFF